MAKKASSPTGFVAFPAPKRQPMLQLVTKEEFEKHGEELAKQGKLINWTFGFILAILAICVIGYFTFLLDSWRFHSETLERFTEELHSVHDKALDARFIAITSRLDSIASHPKTDTQLYLPMQGAKPYSSKK